MKTDRLRETLEALDAKLVQTSEKDAAATILGELKTEGMATLAIDRDPWIAGLGLEKACDAAGIELLLPPVSEDAETYAAWREKLAEVEAGLTSALAIAEETGSALLRMDEPDMRLVSLLPLLHLLVIPEAKVLPDVAAVFTAWQQSGADTNAVVVSGPSRTADIEKELVLGVHGPSKLIVILVGP